MKIWTLRVLLLVAGFGLGFGLVFTALFMEGILPHGGMW